MNAKKIQKFINDPSSGIDSYEDGVVFFNNEKLFENLQKTYATYSLLRDDANSNYARCPNPPDYFTEKLAIYVLGADSVGRCIDNSNADLYDKKNDVFIQLKTSTCESNDCTSFSPKTLGNHKILFLDIENIDNRLTGNALLYEVHPKLFQNIVLNLKKNETFEDQQKQGKRPRTSLKKVIANNNIEPIMEININSLLQAETKKQSKTLFNYLKTINEKIRKILM